MKKLSVLILIFVLAAFVFPLACFANSAAPPLVKIIVSNAPDDLVMTLQPGDIQPSRTDKVLESHFSFYRYDLKSSDYTLEVSTGGAAFEVTINTPQQYNNVYILDLKNHTLTDGDTFSRSFNMTALRVVLTLLFEAVVFFLFGYRQKRSWLIFLVVNLITQGVLNIWLGFAFSPMSYLILALIFGELFVFVAEIAAFLIFVNEHRRWRTFAYVIVANLLSLCLGGWLITYMPV